MRNNLNSTNKNNLNNSRLSNNRGFSLIEVMIVLVLGLIIIGTSMSMYSAFAANSRRQERINLVQHSIDETKFSLQSALTTLPGQGLATTNGQIFSIPQLPAAGSTTDQNGKTVPIQLGIITPYQLTSYDNSINSNAVMLAYSDPTLPRFSISENIKVDLSTGKIRIASPLSIPVKLPLAPPPNGGINPSLGLANNSSSISNSNSNSNSNQTNQTNIIIPPHTPTPTPSPVATPTPTPIAPNVPFNSTILEQNWIPSTDMFHIGDVMLLVNEPSYDATDPTTTQTRSRLIKVTGVASYAPPALLNKTTFVELTFDFCSQGDCGTQFPGLTNTPLAPKTGSIVVPLRLTSFYLKKTRFGNNVVRNDGGVILPMGNGFQIQGGKETLIGESDDFTITYHLNDGTTQPTPSSPVVPWLNNITSIDILLSNSVPSGKGSEQISEKVTFNFPINVRNLQ